MNVVVTNPDTQTGTKTSGFTYSNPTVTSVAPKGGPLVGGTVVTVTGTNFGAGATVAFGGTLATSVTVVSETSLTATTPAHAAGAVTVLVTNTDGTSGSKTSAFTYRNIPTVTSVTPASGPTAGGTSVVIQGTNFVSGFGATTVTFGGVAAASVTYNSTTNLTVVTPAG